MKLGYHALFAIENIDIEAASGVEGARWENFQLDFLSDMSLFRSDNKSRQIAFSFITSLRSIVRATLDGQSSLFVSVNKDEAAEKIRYAKTIMEAMHPDTRPRLIKDSVMILEFANKARLISLASRAPRGKARMDVYLDEFAHAQRDREIYQGALPVISKGGTIRIGSSPMGASGVFWEVHSEALRKYPGYTRRDTPWWKTYAFCRDPREAHKHSIGLTIEQLVYQYGNERIIRIFENIPIDDFLTEYCCIFVDEKASWITWEEIRANQHEERDDNNQLIYPVLLAKGVDKAIEAIEQVGTWISQNKIERVLYAGVDVGRTRDTTEIYFVGLSSVESYPLRLAITLDNVKFKEQENVLAHALNRLPVAKMLIDRNGIGMSLAESLEDKFPVKVEGVNFTNATKTLWATNAKMLVQRQKTPIPMDRDLAYQIHSIKRKITASKNLSFDTDANEKHHADKFWAWALALSAHQALQQSNEDKTEWGEAIAHDLSGYFS